MKKEINIAVIGLGYVGLPLFCLLSKYFPCIGIDKDTVRVTQLKDSIFDAEMILGVDTIL